MTDVDISLTWPKEFSPDTLRRLSKFHVRVVNGFTQIAPQYSDQSSTAETSAIEFLEALESSASELFDSDSELELAFYYNVSEHAHFSASLSPELITTAGKRRIGLKITGYPCTEDQM